MESMLAKGACRLYKMLDINRKMFIDWMDLVSFFLHTYNFAENVKY